MIVHDKNVSFLPNLDKRIYFSITRQYIVRNCYIVTHIIG